MSVSPFLADDEDLSDLALRDYRLIQRKNGFRFSMDAVLLAHFVRPQRKQKIIDLGCGSGVLPILLFADEPTRLITAVEIQAVYADLARRNMALNQVPCQIYESDLRSLPAEWGSTFDAVVSNPPFFPKNCGKLNPNEEINIARHEIYCTLEDLIQSSKRLLKPRGSLYLIYRAARTDELLSLCAKYSLKPKRLRFIHPFADQAANLLLLEAVKGGRDTLEILPPLFIYRSPHVYSNEIIQIYGGNI